MTRDPEFENIQFEVAHDPSKLSVKIQGSTILIEREATSARDASNRLRRANVAPDQYEAGMADYWNNRRMDAQHGDRTTRRSRQAEKNEVSHLKRAVALQRASK